MRAIFQSTVSEFYRQRAGMFFVLLGLLFGFMSGNEHHAFATFFMTDRFGMVYLLAIWIGYTAFCIQFLLNLWKQPDYHFVYHTRLWEPRQRYTRFGLLALGFLQPILYYGVYMCIIAVQDNRLTRIGPIFVFYLLLITVFIASFEWRIRRPRLFVAKKLSVGGSKIPRPKSWIYWTIEWLIREKGVTLLVSKLGTALIFTCTLLYYVTGDYDLRLPAIGLSLGYLLNIGLSYEIYDWESRIWVWGRSLPISVPRRFGRIILIHALILLPETLICFRYHLLSFWEISMLYSLGLSIVLLFHTYLYKKNGLMEDTMKPVLFGFVVLTLLILYKTPILLIAFAFVLASVYQFRKWYYGSVFSNN